MPEEGEKAPRLALPDARGARFDLAGLAGRTVVVWFYAEDGTPACSTQARDFRDLFPDFRASGAEVVGVSPDPPERHAAFARAERIPYPLLADPDRSTMRRWGAWGRKVLYGREVEGVLRSTFVVGPDGRVRRAFRNVRTPGHAARVLEWLKAEDVVGDDGAMKRRGSRRRVARKGGGR